MEKKIDEVCRMLRDYIRTGSDDVGLKGKLSDLFCRISCTKDNSDVNYFIQSLRRELREPEVMNREGSGRASYHDTDYDWRPLGGR